GTRTKAFSTKKQQRRAREEGPGFYSCWRFACAAPRSHSLHADPPARAVADLCSVLIRNPYLRSERETYFLGSARPDTVQVRISDVPGVLRPKRYPYVDSTPVFGQVVRVRSVYGADADRVLASFRGGDSTVVVIRYSFNSM